MKKFSVVLMVLMFSVAVSGAVIENVQVEDGFESSFTGGDTVTASGSFSNSEAETSQFAAVLHVSAEEMSVSGQEFSDVSFSLNGNSSQCSEPIQENRSVVYRCGLASTVEGGENDFSVEAESVPYLMPGNYSFEMELKSEIGLGSENISARVNASSPQTLEVNNVDVSVNASNNATAEVQTFDAVTVPAPDENSEFIRAASVEVIDEGSEVSSSGEVSFTFDEDNLDVPESNIDIYFYNETTQSWSLIDSEVEDGVVSAEVEHFSTYAAFAEEETSDGGSDDSDIGGGSSTVVSGSDTNQQDQETEDTSNQTDDTTDNNQENQVEDNQTQGQEETDEPQGEQNQQDSPDQGITGQFLGSPTNIGGIIAGLIVAMIAALQYFGKIEIRAAIELVREKLEELR